MRLFKKAKELSRKHIGQSSLIFNEGDYGEYAFRILEGRVEIFMGGPNEKVVIAELGPNEVFGEMGMIGRTSRSASALALTAVTLEIMTEDDFNRALLENTNALVPYLSSIFDRMRNMNLLIGEMSARGASYDNQSSKRKLSKTAPVQKVRLLADSDKLRKQGALKNREIDEFPFFIGRRRDSAAIDVFQKNQLAIFDKRPFSISRNHCAIEHENDEFYVRDRGSHTGTIVNGVRINGSGTSIDRVKLDQGENSLILGDVDSESCFKIVLES
jgi:CRP-like cAMP-binding protein